MKVSCSIGIYEDYIIFDIFFSPTDFQTVKSSMTTMKKGAVTLSYVSMILIEESRRILLSQKKQCINNWNMSHSWQQCQMKYRLNIDGIQGMTKHWIYVLIVAKLDN